MANYYAAIPSDGLTHYGVKGMKWGVRKYRNFDGSYTQKGVKMFDKSMEKYESAKSRYDSARKAYKEAKKNKQDTRGMKTEMTNARIQKNKAKSNLKYNYRQLRNDRTADKGKELYSRGKRITYNNTTTSALEMLGGAAITAGKYNSMNGIIGGRGDTKLNRNLQRAGLAALGVSAAKRVKDWDENRKIRAYYSHNGKYRE